MLVSVALLVTSMWPFGNSMPGGAPTPVSTPMSV